MLVSCTQEFDPGLKEVNFKNWKGEKRDKYDKKSRGLRPTGMPTQIQLHETAGLANMAITGASQDKDDKELFYVPTSASITSIPQRRGTSFSSSI